MAKEMEKGRGAAARSEGKRRGERRKLTIAAAVVAAVHAIHSPIASAAIDTWSGAAGDTNFSDGGNWVGNAAPMTGDDVLFPSSSATIVNIDAPISLDSISFSDGSAKYTLGGQTISLTSTANAITLANSVTGNPLETINAPLIVGNSQTWFPIGAQPITALLTGNDTLGASTLTIFSTATASTANISMSGAISGPGSIIKNSNTATLTLSGANTYTGGTTLVSGTININSDSAFGTGPVFENAPASGGNVTLNVTNVTGGTRTIANNITMGGQTNFIFGNTTFANNFLLTGTYTLVPGITGQTTVLNGNTATFAGKITEIGGAALLTIATPNSASGKGTYVFTNGASDYSGGSKLNAGAIVLGADSTVSGGNVISGPLGKGLVTLLDTPGSVNSTVTLAATTIGHVIANPIFIAGPTATGTVVTASTVAFGTTTYTGPLTLAGAITLGNTKALSVTSGDSLTVSGAIGDGGNGFGVISSGSGILNLLGNNTYTGGTTVKAGTTNLSGSPTAANFSVSGGTLNILGPQSASGWINAGGTTVASAQSTFTGGVTDTSGTLTANVDPVISNGAIVSGPFGVGTITLATATTGSTTTVLASAPAVTGTSRVIDNPISISGGGNIVFGVNTTPQKFDLLAPMTINTTNQQIAVASGSVASLAGGISVVPGDNVYLGVINGSSSVNGAAVLPAVNTFSNDVYLRNGIAVVAANSSPSGGALGTGTLYVNDPSSTAQIPTLAAPTGSSFTLGNAVVLRSGGFTNSNRLSIGALVNDSQNNVIGTWNGTLTLAGPVTLTTNMTVNVNGGNASIAATTANISSAIGDSGGGYSLTKIGAGTLNLSGANTYTGATVVGAGVLGINSSLTASSSLTVSDGARAIMSSSGANVVKVGALTLLGSGTLDVNNNDLVVTYAGGASPLATIYPSLVSGFNAGNWNGNGIASLAAHNDPTDRTALGYIDTGSEVDVKYTYYGDSNIDGKVDTTDFQMFLDGLVASGTSWAQGDYTYDGHVDLGNDFNLFLINYLELGGSTGALAEVVQNDDQLSTSQLAMLLSAVPEPGGLVLLAGAAMVMRRRRKECK